MIKTISQLIIISNCTPNTTGYVFDASLLHVMQALSGLRILLSGNSYKCRQHSGSTAALCLLTSSMACFWKNVIWMLLQQQIAFALSPLQPCYKDVLKTKNHSYNAICWIQPGICATSSLASFLHASSAQLSNPLSYKDTIQLFWGLNCALRYRDVQCSASCNIKMHSSQFSLGTSASEDWSKQVNMIWKIV